MRKSNERTRDVLVQAMVDFQHLRVLAEQLEQCGLDLGAPGEAVFLLSQVAIRIARDGEQRTDAESGLLLGEGREGGHA